jgi:hypothetical protein
MSTAWVPPRRAYHLRVFAVSLILVLVCLVAFLVFVRMEAIVPATGVIAARGQQDLRAPFAGLVELGWYEGDVPEDGTPVRIRVDKYGDGVADPAELWPGQILARVEPAQLELELSRLKARLADLESAGKPTGEVQVQIQTLRDQLAKAVLPVPDQTNHWLVLKVHSEQRQSVAAGEPMALIAPLDAATHQPKDLTAFLDVHEKHTGELSLGQPVRIYSTMYNQRLHGHALGRIERLEPLGEPAANGERRFRAVVAITDTPYLLRVGSSFKAEIVVGRKQVYRIILEQ